ncbi:hypothetical protein [Frigoriglobus tundricola]|uniref:Uncharacterized protein n=1 Tax=Frigoriglobus tundricola TaxID=2774151 RepID=A0A6M5Z2W5_9BACT|nr:hypothetical protein [Frigoriglobus tundricola]QJX00589.1 hypothetical protein FTUN_8221 [Frigoriglobus tundricola]
MDVALAGLVVVFAFAAASFTARNSDVWIHLAAGQRLLTGQYVPGTDPFSFSGADRPWVNHSWLVDAASYLLYGGQGKVLVIAKAVIVALAFGTVIGIRRPRFALWPWAAVAGVAVLASAPHLVLRPNVVSVLFLAITLFLLFRVNHRPNSWRFPGAIGVTFWLWANSDPWFFIGPMALALIIVGDLIQTNLLDAPGGPEPAGGDEPLGRAPDTRTLAKALGVGVLACMLNPHHVRVWELPFELVGAPNLEGDVRFKLLLMSPTSSDFINNPGYGQNANGLAYAVLVVAGAAVLGFGPGRVRVGNIALWIGFAALSLRSVFAIPFFAVVAVPLIAGQLNALSARIGAEQWADPKKRPLLIGSSLGRALCALAVCAGCVLAYPGWVHPDISNPAYARRISWAVEPEPSLKQAAEQFQRWHETGALPADAHGLVASTDLANYLAWFAPQEKVFFNARYNFHRPELTDFFALRRGLGLLAIEGERPNPKDTTAVLEKWGAEYLAVYTAAGDSLFTRLRAIDAASGMYRNEDNWSPWYVDGRTTVFGWRAPGGPARPTFARLRVDPVILAFGPQVVPVPPADLLPPLPQLGWEGAFIRPAQVAPVGAAEALGWARFKEGPATRQGRRGVVRENVSRPLFVLGVPSVTNFSMHQFAMVVTTASGGVRFEPNEATPAGAAASGDANEMAAVPLLALRAARRAIAENPDHPDAYYALAQALRDKDLPLTEGERLLGIVTAYRQCLERLPPPEQYKRGQFETSPTEVALQLALIYLNPRSRRDPKTGKEKLNFIGMALDVAPLSELLGQSVFEDAQGRQIRVMTADRGRVKIPSTFRPVTGDTPHVLPIDAARKLLERALAYGPADFAGDPADRFQEWLQGVESVLKEVEANLIQAREQYDQFKDRGLPVAVDRARRNGLIVQAVDLLVDKEAELAAEYREGVPQAMILRVGMELVLGRIERANALLDVLGTGEWDKQFKSMGLAGAILQLKYVKALIAGEYKAAGDIWETLAGAEIGLLDNMPPPGPTVPAPFVSRTIGAMLGKQSPTDDQKAVDALLHPPFISSPFSQPLALFQLRLLAGVTDELRVRVAFQLQTESAFFFRRGALSLLEGDIASAKQRFRQSTRKPPPGWGLPEYSQQSALGYLKLIELAEKRAAP